MPAAALYWRVRTRDARTSNPHTLAIAELRLYDAAGVELVPTAITCTTVQNAGGFPLSNMSDGNTGTVCYIGGGTASNAWDYIVYEFATPVLPDYASLHIHASAVPGGYTRQFGYETDVTFDSSADNITWAMQAGHTRPMPSEGVTYQIAVHTSSNVYPLPSRTALAGTGGIYGIVSEDGVALPNRPVMLYERDGFTRVGATTTDENGGYAFNGLNEANEYLVLSADPSGPPYKNAIVWDRITPINTRAAQVPTSKFWARRLRDASYEGGLAFANYLDGASYNYLLGTPGTGATNWIVANVPVNGYSFAVAEAAGGAVRFLQSNHTGSSGGGGIAAYPFEIFSNSSFGNPANYAWLTFEYVFIPPTGTEPNLIITACGCRETDAGIGMYWDNGYYDHGAGPTLQVTTSAANFRMPLGGANTSTIRATTAVVQGEIHHIVVTYSMDNEIKMYKNGVLVATTSIAGSGRPYTYCVAQGYYNDRRVDNWNANYTLGGSVWRWRGMSVTGEGPVPNTGSSGSCGPGWGGGFGMALLYSRVMNQTDVSALYDSFVNPSTHDVLPTQSGYSAEVEADNPLYYWPLNHPSRPSDWSDATAVGAKGRLIHLTNTTYGETGFTSGRTAIGIASTNAGVYMYNASRLWSPAFSFECFIRATSFSNSPILLIDRVYNSHAPFYINITTGGVVQINITDKTGTVLTYAFSGIALSTATNYHIVVTYDPWVTFKTCLYVNGVAYGEQSATTMPYVNHGQVGDNWTGLVGWTGIGCNPSGTGPTWNGSFFNGVIGEVAIYNHVLPAARVLAHYDARNA